MGDALAHGHEGVHVPVVDGDPRDGATSGEVVDKRGVEQADDDIGVLGVRDVGVEGDAVHGVEERVVEQQVPQDVTPVPVPPHAVVGIGEVVHAAWDFVAERPFDEARPVLV